MARELENPFRNAPNEIPVCLLQAMYNEALATMFSGFNPDAFWDPAMYQGAFEALAVDKMDGKDGTESGAADATLATPAPAEAREEDGTTAAPEKRTHVAVRTNAAANDDSPVCDYELFC